MVGSVLLVLIVELLNSAIEAATDRIFRRYVLAKRAMAWPVAVVAALIDVPVMCCWSCSIKLARDVLHG